MNISHSRARQIIHSASYQILDNTEQAALSGHLQDCRQCAEYADQLPQLENLLANSLQQRWLQPIPAGEIDLRIRPDIEGRVKRKQNLNQLTNSLRVLAWSVGILALVMITSWVISRARSQDVASLTPPLLLGLQHLTSIVYRLLELTQSQHNHQLITMRLKITKMS